VCNVRVDEHHVGATVYTVSAFTGRDSAPLSSWHDQVKCLHFNGTVLTGDVVLSNESSSSWAGVLSGNRAAMRELTSGRSLTSGNASVTAAMVAPRVVVLVSLVIFAWRASCRVLVL
jgi:hypothetical protein